MKCMKWSYASLAGLVGLMVLAGGASAHAAMSDVASRSDDVIIGTAAAPVNLVISAIPQHAGLFGDYAKLASVSASPASSTETVAFRWSPGLGVPQTGRYAYIVTYPGKNNPQHSLAVDMEACVDTDGATWTRSEWFLAKKPGPVDCFISTMGEQDVASDIYTIYLDAGVWTE